MIDFWGVRCLAQHLSTRKCPPRTPTRLHSTCPGRGKKTEPCARGVCHTGRGLVWYISRSSPVASGFLTGHAAAGVIVHTGAAVSGLSKQPWCCMSLKPRLLSQKNLWVILFEGMFYKHWALLGFEPNPAPVKFTSPIDPVTSTSGHSGKGGPCCGPVSLVLLWSKHELSTVCTRHGAAHGGCSHEDGPEATRIIGCVDTDASVETYQDKKCRRCFLKIS